MYRTSEAISSTMAVSVSASAAAAVAATAAAAAAQFPLSTTFMAATGRAVTWSMPMINMLQHVQFLVMTGTAVDSGDYSQLADRLAWTNFRFSIINVRTTADAAVQSPQQSAPPPQVTTLATPEGPTAGGNALATAQASGAFPGRRSLLQDQQDSAKQRAQSGLPMPYELNAYDTLVVITIVLLASLLLHWLVLRCWARWGKHPLTETLVFPSTEIQMIDITLNGVCASAGALVAAAHFSGSSAAPTAMAVLSCLYLAALLGVTVMLVVAIIRRLAWYENLMGPWFPRRIHSSSVLVQQIPSARRGKLDRRTDEEICQQAVSTGPSSRRARYRRNRAGRNTAEFDALECKKAGEGGEVGSTPPKQEPAQDQRQQGVASEPQQPSENSVERVMFSPCRWLEGCRESFNVGDWKELDQMGWHARSLTELDAHRSKSYLDTGMGLEALTSPFLTPVYKAPPEAGHNKPGAAGPSASGPVAQEGCLDSVRSRLGARWVLQVPASPRQGQRQEEPEEQALPASFLPPPPAPPPAPPAPPPPPPPPPVRRASDNEVSSDSEGGSDDGTSVDRGADRAAVAATRPPPSAAVANPHFRISETTVAGPRRQSAMDAGTSMVASPMSTQTQLRAMTTTASTMGAGLPHDPSRGQVSSSHWASRGQVSSTTTALGTKPSGAAPQEVATPGPAQAADSGYTSSPPPQQGAGALGSPQPTRRAISKEDIATASHTLQLTDRYGYVLAAYRGDAVLATAFFLPKFLVTIIIAVLLGVQAADQIPNGSTTSKVLLIIVLVLKVFMVLYLVLLRPYSNLLDVTVEGVSHALETGAVICLLALQFTTSRPWERALLAFGIMVTIFQMAALWLFTILPALPDIWAFIKWSVRSLYRCIVEEPRTKQYQVSEGKEEGAQPTLPPPSERKASEEAPPEQPMVAGNQLASTISLVANTR